MHSYSHAPSYGLDLPTSLDPWKDARLQWNQAAARLVAPVVGPSKRTTDPITTGTSVLAIKYEGGILMTADTLVSYGSLARFRSCERMKAVGNFSIIGASGEYSDFQATLVTLDELIDRDNAYEDGSKLYPREIFSYLSRVMYNRRSKMDPLYNQFVLAGFRDGQSFLGQVDLYGTAFEDTTLATGYGAYIAKPLLRKAVELKPKLTEEEAKKVLEDCMRVLFYRDARAINRIQLAKVSAEGVTISAPYSLETEWCSNEGALGYPRPE